MTPQEFCYWLQGLMELQPDLKTLNEAQVQMVRDHLGYVFTHVQTARQPTAAASSPFSAKEMWEQAVRQTQGLSATAIARPFPQSVAVC